MNAILDERDDGEVRSRLAKCESAFRCRLVLTCSLLWSKSLLAWNKASRERCHSAAASSWMSRTAVGVFLDAAR